MLKPIMLSLVMIGGIQAHAERFPAANYGLTPETGYTEAVTVGEPCDQKTNVLLKDESGYERFITKCDGSLIGWVTRVIKPEDLHNDYHSSNEFDLQVKTPVIDKWGNRDTNIYVCDDGRADELEQFPKVVPATDAKGVQDKMLDIKARGKAQIVQLFFNEWILSGKCIGGIKEINFKPSVEVPNIDAGQLLKKLKNMKGF